MRRKKNNEFSKTARGGKVRTAKLTETQVTEILTAYTTTGATQRELAKRYGVSSGTIQGIVTSRTWKHVLRGAEVGWDFAPWLDQFVHGIVGTGGTPEQLLIPSIGEPPPGVTVMIYGATALQRARLEPKSQAAQELRAIIAAMIPVAHVATGVFNAEPVAGAEYLWAAGVMFTPVEMERAA